MAALAEERIRVARELHGIVAHSLNAMVIQSAGAGAALLDDDSAEARAAVEVIGHGREASAPGHGLIGMRERAETFGGTARGEPLPDGGFRVEATLRWV
ncbi:histidine kinase [Nonomuraea jabiensis]|uniref:histidine kinase n=1 Tax=Nonomuraea jabiensis TaxID=882448 RepID=A0A7W9LGP9_9ACTN|nr:histidine kinase [Nonomuraea jabiensis]MBB5783073.1 signal transduction histidine kinase [Nonomuraea jabiensis]